MSLASRIAALATRIGTELHDTGWIQITPSGGATGALRARQIGKVIYAYGSLQGTFPPGATEVGYLPNAMRPLSAEGAARLWTPQDVAGSLTIVTTGQMLVINTGAITVSRALFSVAAPIG